jgi:hypothetical protein
MPKKLHEMNEDELRREFLIMATTFFQWNAHSNIPNILLQLSGRLEALQARAKEAADQIELLRDTAKTTSDASGKLSSALNRFTLALVIVGAIGLIVQAAYVFFYIWTYFHPKA